MHIRGLLHILEGMEELVANLEFLCDVDMVYVFVSLLFE